MGRPRLTEGQVSITVSFVIRAVTRQAYEAIAETEESETGSPTTLSTVMRRALEDWLVGRTRHDHELPTVTEVKKKYNLDNLPED